MEVLQQVRQDHAIHTSSLTPHNPARNAAIPASTLSKMCKIHNVNAIGTLPERQLVSASAFPGPEDRVPV